MTGLLKEAEVAAQTMGIHLQLVPAISPDDIAGAFAAITKQRPEALIVFPSPMLFSQYSRIATMATDIRLPATGVAREFAEVGGLMSYGVNLSDLSRQTALYVEKILKGAKPAELPVEQPTKFEFVINLKTAKALGLIISNQMQLLADEVIE